MLTDAERSRELERFKTEIDLRQYAAGVCGYKVETSYKTGTTLRKAAPGSSSDPEWIGAKITVRKWPDGHWWYRSWHHGHSGSIIDFIAHERGYDGKVPAAAYRGIMEELRAWIGSSHRVRVPMPRLEPVEVNLSEVVARFAHMEQNRASGYLLDVRKIPAWVLSSSLFCDSVYLDPSPHRNVVFPHYDAFPVVSVDDVCGYEIRNTNFKGFSPGGMKGLWTSRYWKSASSLVVICESAIDAMSYAALFKQYDAFYVSIAGAMSQRQIELLTHLVTVFDAGPAELRVIAAMDADDAGRKYAEQVGNAVSASSRKRLAYLTQYPERFKDWNEELCALAREREGKRGVVAGK